MGADSIKIAEYLVYYSEFINKYLKFDDSALVIIKIAIVRS